MTDLHLGLPCAGKNALYLERAELKLEAIAVFLKQKSTEGTDFAPKLLTHISSEIEEILNILIEIDRRHPENEGG